jgi:hypothetical protein
LDQPIPQGIHLHLIGIFAIHLTVLVRRTSLVLCPRHMVNEKLTILEKHVDVAEVPSHGVETLAPESYGMARCQPPTFSIFAVASPAAAQRRPLHAVGQWHAEQAEAGGQHAEHRRAQGKPGLPDLLVVGLEHRALLVKRGEQAGYLEEVDA